MIYLLSIVAIVMLFAWVYTLSKENKRLREKYQICCEERTELNVELTKSGNQISELRDLARVRGDELYKYEHLAITEGPKLGMPKQPMSGLEIMQWIVTDCHQVQGRLRTALHDYDVKLAQLLEAESVNDVLRKQSECYRISRDQARDDIQGLLLFMVATEQMVNQTQLDVVRKSVIGQEIPQEVRDAKTFERFDYLATNHNLRIRKLSHHNDIVPSPKRRPRKAASGS